MKHFSILITALLISAYSFSQTITRENLPMVNDSVAGVYVTNQTTWHAGSAGQNASWDFSGWAGDPFAFEYEEVAENSVFVNSDMKLGMPSLGDLYFRATASQYFLSGTESVYEGQQVTIPYSDPQQLLFFPFTYGNSLEDTAKGSFTTTIDGNTGTIRRTIYSETTGDGSGTLILPGQEYEDVLRVKITSEIIDSVFGIIFGTPVFIEKSISTTEEYLFLSPDYKHQLVYMIYVQSGTTPYDFTFYFPGAKEIVGTQKALAGLSDVTVYPNPASDFIIVQGSKPNTRIRILNQLGAPVKTEGLSTSGKVSVSDLPSGMYFYELISNDQVVNTGRINIR